jgi:CheY-like chemotaxis protein
MRQILIVDDDQRIREFMSATLADAGFAVRTAENGAKAMRSLERQGDVDLVVTDILMPDHDGIGLILKLRSLPARPRILAISGGGMIPATDYLANAGLLGADACLPKPFSGLQLVDQVRRLFDESADSCTADLR